MSENIFDSLREDHQVQRKLLDNLINTAGDTREREYFFNLIKEELSQHAKAEERYFYNPLIESDATIEKSRHSIAEHHQIDKLIETIESSEPDSPGWLTNAKSLHHKVIHHLDEEEREVFQMAGKVLTATQKKDLATSYETEMDKIR